MISSRKDGPSVATKFQLRQTFAAKSAPDLDWQLQLLDGPPDVVQEVARLGRDSPDLLLLEGQMRTVTQQKNLEDGTPEEGPIR